MAKRRSLTKKETVQQQDVRKAKTARKRTAGKTLSEKERKADDPERENPITVTLYEDGSYQFHGRSLQPTIDKNRVLEPYGKQVIEWGQQIRILPEDSQAGLIRKTNGCARYVKKDYLTARQDFYKQTRQTLSVAAYKRDNLKKLKAENSWLNEVDKFALESAIENVDKAYEHFFKDGFGFPKMPSRYKPNGNRYTTKFTNNNIALVMVEGLPYIKLPKLGNVRFVMPAGKKFEDLVPKGAHILKATVIKDGRNYLVSLCLETVIEKIVPVQSFTASEIIGMDMGIKYFCDYGTKDGKREKVDNPRFIMVHAKRLRRFQKALSRKKYDQASHTGSKNYYKAKDKVAKEQRKVANQRKDFQHKLSRKITNSCTVFVCEDLNIKGMMKNRHLARAIASVGWYSFLEKVKYKIERKGGIFLKVSRWFPSSKTCTHCGCVKQDLTMNDRYWTCPECHILVDRDDNAVDNIIKEGIRILLENHMAVLLEEAA